MGFPKSHGAEANRKFYGSYPAYVYDNKDVEFRGRVRVICPGLNEEKPIAGWFEPSDFGAGPARGVYWPPEVGDSVWVTFDHGEVSFPLRYTGGARHKGDLPLWLQPDSATGRPYKRGFTTRSGQFLVFDDTPGDESVTILHRSPLVNNVGAIPNPSIDKKHPTVRIKLGGSENKGGVQINGENFSSVFSGYDPSGNKKAVISFTVGKDETTGARIQIVDGGIDLIADGSGISIRDGQITMIGKVATAAADQTINATSVNLGSGPLESAVNGDTFIGALKQAVVGIQTTQSAIVPLISGLTIATLSTNGSAIGALFVDLNTKLSTFTQVLDSQALSTKVKVGK